MRRVIVVSPQPARCPNNSIMRPVRVVTYGECQRNQAARLGGHVLDGCNDFIASGEEGTAAALTCAACGCHRNFHRREIQITVVCDCSSHPTNNGA
ncbi:hypothetical protein VNO78_15033 [Psophocarpus tetragonolobus]|uniref:ZF-HD dimerization-type domain-containing protein n=1 Tax=Psophocarpus tetragonolobus TaxID=3891 RepID=A0AAN9SF82_PSOTE